jgi:1-deoxy-D-xylulose-5-phosphate reductoisomerase
MQQFEVKPADSLEIILDVDKQARKLSNKIIDELIG